MGRNGQCAWRSVLPSILEEPVSPPTLNSGRWPTTPTTRTHTHTCHAEWLFYRAEGTEAEGNQAECLDWVVMSQLALRANNVLLFVIVTGSRGGGGEFCVNCDGCVGCPRMIMGREGGRSGEEEEDRLQGKSRACCWFTTSGIRNTSYSAHLPNTTCRDFAIISAIIITISSLWPLVCLPPDVFFFVSHIYVSGLIWVWNHTTGQDKDDGAGLA